MHFDKPRKFRIIQPLKRLEKYPLMLAPQFAHIIFHHHLSCRHHEGHKRVAGNGSNWHRKRRQLCDREKTRTYIIDKYGLKAWHGD